MKTTTHALTYGLLLLAFFSVQTIKSQTQVAGSISDANGKSLPAASVLLLNGADSTLVRGQLSGLDGTYKFSEVAAGEYRIGVSMLGFSYNLSPLFTLNNSTGVKDLGQTVLQEAA